MDVGLRTPTTTLAPPRNALHIAGASGEIYLWELTPTVYATSVRGVMTRPMSQLIIDNAEGLYDRAKTVHGFHDWFQMTSYESACRVELTAWVHGHREESELHIGVASAIVAMGVAVANLALGNLIHIHTRKPSMSLALADTLRRRDARAELRE